jgi:hypothetical protein
MIRDYRFVWGCKKLGRKVALSLSPKPVILAIDFTGLFAVRELLAFMGTL